MKELIYSVLRRLSFILVVVTLFAGTAAAQVKYPQPVTTGDTLIFKSGKKSHKIIADADTFWILKNSQYKNAIIAAKKNKLCEEQVIEYKNQTNLLNERSAEQDKLIETLKKDRDFYQAQLSDCESDVSEFAKKCKTQKLISRIAIVVIPVAFVLGFILAK